MRAEWPVPGRDVSVVLKPHSQQSANRRGHLLCVERGRTEATTTCAQALQPTLTAGKNSAPCANKSPWIACTAYVRFWHKADITIALNHVRFWR
jgi:hypothetical protein